MLGGGFAAFRGKRILLLQGPVGPFFRRLARDLERVGAHVHKVNFNGGDWLFYPTGARAFRGTMREWPGWFEALLRELRIDQVLLFGDCRPVHRPVLEIARRCDVEVGVFEEGYIRPNYISLERHGVNGHSRIPRSPIFYLNRPIVPASPVVEVGNTFWFSALWAVLYYSAAAGLRPFFPHYRHHRPLSFLESLPWVRSVWRKAIYRLTERGLQAMFASALSKKYFLVPLQLYNDSQISEHSDYPTVEAFIREVVASFAGHAPRDAYLVIKHHPLDRGYSDYARLIRALASEHGLKGRVYYVHDLHLPTLLDHARGVVTVNSTVGLSALIHGAPLKVCGRALYDMEGLTYTGVLDNFWREAPMARPMKKLLRGFIHYLIAHTQINGSFYRRVDAFGGHAGIGLAAAGSAGLSKTARDASATEAAVAEAGSGTLDSSLAPGAVEG